MLPNQPLPPPFPSTRLHNTTQNSRHKEREEIEKREPKLRDFGRPKKNKRKKEVEMLQMQQSSIFADSPSFNSYSCDKFAEIAAKVSEEFSGEREEFGLESIDHLQFLQLVEEEMSSKEVQITNIDIVAVVPEQQQQQRQQKQEQEEEEEEDHDQGKDVQQNKKVEETNGDDDDDDDDDDFEFAFVCRDQDGSPIAADEIFSNGQIRPFFPVFNRDLLFEGGHDDDEAKPQEDDDRSSSLRRRNPLKKLLIEDREPQSSSSSEADELEGLSEGTYCVWTPKPVEASLERCKKSSSTGTSRRWRFRDFLFRSNSDGKDTFVFLTPSPSKKKRDEKSTAAAAADQKSTQVSDQERKLKASGTETNKVAGGTKMKGKEASAHEIHYIRNRAMKEGDKRRSYLPYRQDLVGIFSNVNGLSRNLHPF